MPPLNLKQSPSQTLTSTTAAAASSTSQDARLLVRETLRISANLASAPPNHGSPSLANHPGESVSQSQPLLSLEGTRLRGLVEEEFVDSSFRLICCEEIDGRRWRYVAEKDAAGGFKKNSIRAISLQTPQAPVD